MKFLIPLLLVAMTACTSAPATVRDADSAGRSRVRQIQKNERGTVKFPDKVLITFNGDVGNVTLLDQSGDIDGDQGGGMSNQGATETTGSGASATQSPRADGPQTDVQVPVTK